MSAQAATTQRARPIQRLALHSTVTCSAQATVYGKCILATYTDVKKDICKEEFAAFKDCIQKAVSIILLFIAYNSTPTLDEEAVMAD